MNNLIPVFKPLIEKEEVASLFSLEHVPDTLGSLRQIKKLLKPDGILYLVVPNMFSENTADMIRSKHAFHCMI